MAFDPREEDARLEGAVNQCMDYLANEGLLAPNLFRTVPPKAIVEAAIEDVLAGETINFVAVNDPALCTAVLMAGIRRMNKPLFPVHLLDALAEAQQLSVHDPPETKHLRAKQILTSAAMQGTVSSTFLNLVGLLNLLGQNTASNGTSYAQLASTFAPDWLPDHGRGQSTATPEGRAAMQLCTRVMTELIIGIYFMFPANEDDQGGGHPPLNAEQHGQPRPPA
eukprot:CAMPEP_0174917396 /NCGR_PEP_ID=MMETSP1355-20121228/2420_1 /TAXON_ID=464990 /ORGANISM="Hemiselmis tepida, Strain CCMP443" /LENGTH=222 /DNA_ID=CAMNT_0016162477 /DNA_START=158 /DNA_END=822 /DNA_ORIENTATION=+